MIVFLIIYNNQKIRNEKIVRFMLDQLIRFSPPTRGFSQHFLKKFSEYFDILESKIKSEDEAECNLQNLFLLENLKISSIFFSQPHLGLEQLATLS